MGRLGEKALGERYLSARADPRKTCWENPGTVKVTPMGACRVRTGTRERWTGSRPARTSGQNGLGQLRQLPQPTLQIGRRRLAIGTQPCDLRFQVAYSRP